MTIDTANWMDLVKGAKKLSELSIPGTHDSGSRAPESDTLRLTTQSRTIPEQLADGIRFLDIRVGYTNNEFALYHEDVSVNLTFQGVLDDCKAFLAAHPRETIIMSIKKEDKAPTSGNTQNKTFQQRFDAYATASTDASGNPLFYQGDTIPLLSAVRGNIVLFRRFELDEDTPSAGHGINAFRGFPDDDTGSIDGPAKLEIQDKFAQSGGNTRTRNQKFAAVTELLDMASRPGSDPNVLYVNFVSAAGIVESDFDHDDPEAIADDLNPRLEAYFRMGNHRQGRFGIIVTDFETADRNRLVIRTNLPLDGGYWIVEQDGSVSAFGSAETQPGTSNPHDVVAIAPTPSFEGYYLLTRDKKVRAFGDAGFQGGGGPDSLAVSITVKPDSTTPAGAGYWVLYANGKVRAFNANNHGQIEDGTALEPVAIVATPDGGGYWILAVNGRIHNFGNAVHFGDRRDAGQLNTAMARTPDGGGYWILASTGAVHAFGNAVHYGQDKEGGVIAKGIAATRDGKGYWVLSTDGDVNAYGSAPYLGRVRHTEATVGIAADLRPPAA